MKSISLKGFREFTEMESEKPQAGGKWVTIKVKNCAICGSDNMFWSNPQVPAGFTLGHEFSGYIEDGGEYGFKKGQKVCAAEFNSCGECEFCKSGREQLCAQMMLDNPGVSAPGAYGEYVKVRGDYVIEMPDDMPVILGSIVEPVAVSLHGVNYLGIKPGEDVLVSGNGPIGIYAALTAKILGAGKVIMTGRSQSRVDFCNKFDFVDSCLSVKDPEYAEKLKAVTPQGGFKHIIDAVGVEDYDTLISLASPGATIVALGMHAQKASFTPMNLFLKELTLRTGLYFSWADYKQSFEMIKDHQDVFMSTITSVIPAEVDAVQAAFVKLFASGTNDECKIVIEHKD
ncbi:MAG: alcohol dehydrogenase catalytic domain-containing protein [Erysipelotrichia bacterium]|nr:alcohol dehydrogenase catalytic domain-containing protein [Erysipelotrichia bacterium]